ncbi:MAG: hypothetical protein IT306_12610 [Chloroflexi bacterium]|nr:hypothetical protein [Chloroflexota bacterium]
MDESAEERYQVRLETTVGEALFVVLGAADIFERHGCAPTIECTEEHHAEYMLGDLELVCHIDDSVALVADLNAELDAEEAAREAAATAA